MATRQRTTTEKIRVGIIGGSIAGCTAAIEMDRLGFACTLLERSGDELKDRGAGIGVPPSVMKTFIERKLIDADTPYFEGHAFTRIWRTQSEKEYGYVAWDQPANLALLNWGALYRNLRDRVPNEVYKAGHHATVIRQLPDNTVAVELQGGKIQYFDLLICADGYTSLGRSTIFPESTLDYVGYVLWRGFLPESAIQDPGPMEKGIRCLGYPGGHGIFYFVPGLDGSVAPGTRLVNWGMYLPVPQSELAEFLTDKKGYVHSGSLPPGGMPLPTEQRLKSRAHNQVPSYYAEILEKCENTFAYAIYDCHVPAYRKGRVCLVGDAGAFARPHTAAGALKGINDSVALGQALKRHGDIELALEDWSSTCTATNNGLVEFGKQLGQALVLQIPDWSTMDSIAMEKWFTSIVTVKTEVLDPDLPSRPDSNANR